MLKKHSQEADKQKPKSFLGKAWYFIWEDNSPLSWIVNIILAFVIIKFILYPGLGFIFQTGFPIVAVVSQSMQHNNGFDAWWTQEAICKGDMRCTQQEWYSEYGVTEQDFRKFPFRNGFNKGDIIFLKGTPPDKIKIGDVVVYSANKEYPIIHRVVDTWQEDENYYFMTKGDNNMLPISDSTLNEKKVSSRQILGKGIFRVPWLGYVKIWFVEFLRLFGANM